MYVLSSEGDLNQILAKSLTNATKNDGQNFELDFFYVNKDPEGLGKKGGGVGG